MGIIERFNDEFGMALDLEDKEIFGGLFLTLGASRVAALLDWGDFEDDELILNGTIKKINWKPFTLRIKPKDDLTLLMADDLVGFKWYFVEKAINVIEPNEYAVINTVESYILGLKNGHYVILIAPVEFDGGEDFEFYNVIDIESAVKKPTGEAFAL